MRWLPHLITPLLLSGNGAVMAERAELLHIEPHLCVLAADQSRCDMTVLVRWQNHGNADVLCLSHQGAAPVFCSDQADVDQAIVVSLASDTRFELRRQIDNHLLAAVTITVATPMNDLRPRRRHGWGIF